ncbi:MAG: hypothetical protein Q4G52_02495 [Clostridia bacterium]|nr:hypothetical protein [Clostridia bacterium]
MIKQALTPYLRRLRAEALLRAILSGFLAGCAAELLFLLSMHAFASQPRASVCLALFAAAGLLGAVLGYALCFRPTLRGAAGRLDAAGLEERIRTMVDCDPAATPLHRAQRADALSALTRFAPSRLSLRLPKRLFVLCLLGALAVAAVAALPYDRLSPVPLEQPESEEMRLMREMLDSLRAQIEAANLEDEERNRLLAQLEEAGGAMLAGDGSLDQLAQITRAVGEITQELEEIEMFKSWVYRLTAYENLKPLAEALLREDAERTSAVLAEMEAGLLALSGQEQLDALMALKTPIQEELAAGEPDDSEAYLCYAFDSFANDMESAAVYLYSHLNPTLLIHSGFERMKSRMAMLLSGEAVLEEAEDSDDTLYVSRGGEDADLSAESDSASAGGQGDGEGQAHQMLYSADPDGRWGAGVGTREQQYHADAERLVEPSLIPELDGSYIPGARGEDGVAQLKPAPEEESEGSVPYDQVYGLYYAQLLDQIASYAIPEDAVEIVEAYFYGM